MAGASEDGQKGPLCPGDTTIPRLLEGRCLSVQWPGVPCRACAEACPTAAVDVGERSIGIALDRCLRCGRCAAACPTEALAIAGSEPLPESAGRIECARVPAAFQRPGTVVVPCTGGLSPNVLRAWLARTTDGAPIIVDRGWCAECPAGGTAEPWASAVAQLARETDRLGSPRRIVVAREPLPSSVAGPPPSPPRLLAVKLDRRALLGGAVRRDEPERTHRIEARGSGRPRPVEAGALRERARRLAALAADGRAPASLFPEVVVADTCRDNRLCAATCPTGALLLELEEETSSLLFDPEICTGCRSCVEVCPTASLALSPAGEAEPVRRRVLRRRSLVRCVGCGARYHPPSASGRCPTCEKDHELLRFVHHWVRRASATEEPHEPSHGREGRST